MLSRRRVRRRSSRWWALITVAAAMSVVAGCTAVPSSGPVRQGNEAARADVRIFAAKPFGGESVEDIVRGFMFAMADFSGNHSIARMYLTPEAADAWQPAGGATVIASRGFENGAGPQFKNGSVNVTTNQVGEVDPDGYFRPIANKPVSASYHLVKVDGEWRIDNPSKQLWLLRSEIESDFHQATLYFPSAAGRPLVPRPVWLPADFPDSATQLVRQLVAGPPAELAAATTAFPSGMVLESPVSVSGGTATVKLSSPWQPLQTAAMQDLVASLVWTLRAEPEIQNVTVIVGGQVEPFQSSVTDRTWRVYDPDGPRGPGLFGTALDGGMVNVALGTAVPFAAGSHESNLTDFVVAPPTMAEAAAAVESGKAIAASELNAGRYAAAIYTAPSEPKRLYVGTLDQLHEVRRADSFTQPSWDRLGYVWTVEQVGTAQHIIAGLHGDKLSVIKAPSLAAATVSELRVSPDGSRVAVVESPAPSGTGTLLVGSIVRNAQGQPTGIADLHDVTPSLVSVSDVAWASATSLAVLGIADASGPVTVSLVDVDGWVRSELPQLGDLKSIAAAPGSGIAALTTHGIVYTYSGVSWQQYGTGLRDIAYVG